MGKIYIGTKPSKTADEIDYWQKFMPKRRSAAAVMIGLHDIIPTVLSEINRRRALYGARTSSMEWAQLKNRTRSCFGEKNDDH
ncbi:hypothetical protein ACFS4T_25505 [Pseudomonas lini]